MDDRERLSEAGKGTLLGLDRPRVATVAKQDESCVARAEARLAGDATPPFEDDLEDASRALTLVPQVRNGLIARMGTAPLFARKRCPKLYPAFTPALRAFLDHF